MSVDHSLQGRSPFASKDAPAFLSVSSGDFVIVQAEQLVARKVDSNWWIVQVVFCEGKARVLMVNIML